MTADRRSHPRIAMVSRTGRGQTGSVNIIMENARRFVAAGWDVTLVAQRLDAKDLRRRGIVGQRIRESWWPWARPQRERFKQRAESWIASQDFDLVVAHGELQTQDVVHIHNCVHLAHELIHGVPLPVDNPVGTVHRTLLTSQRFRALIANSDMMRRDLIQRFNIPENLVHTVHPGYGTERFRRDDRARFGPSVRSRLRIPADRLLIGFITSGNFQKRGLDLVIAAVAGLPERLRNTIHLLVVGSDGRTPEFHRQAAAAGIGDRFTALGHQDAIEAYYHAADLYVLPARIEEYGLAPQEAMVCGLPAIVSDRMGVAERLPSGDRGGVLPAGDLPALRSALERFVSDPGLRQNWAEVCYRACVGNTWEVNWASHRTIYETVIAAKRAAQPKLPT